MKIKIDTIYFSNIPIVNNLLTDVWSFYDNWTVLLLLVPVITKWSNVSYLFIYVRFVFYQICYHNLIWYLQFFFMFFLL